MIATPRECTTPEGTAVVRDINTDQLFFLPKRRLIQRGTYNVHSLNMAISQQFRVGQTVLFQLTEYAQIKYNMYGECPPSGGRSYCFEDICSKLFFGPDHRG